VPAEATRPTLAQALLAPRSIALVGASDDVSKTSARPLQYLRRAGYEGIVYPINPRRKMVLSEQAWPSMAELPSVPDHAFILTPTEGVIQAAMECARAGVSVATILASGFSEGGEEGLKLVARCSSFVLRRGCAFWGRPASVPSICTTRPSSPRMRHLRSRTCRAAASSGPRIAAACSAA
jgi:acetate---CoA ligase (ADP-forming)